MPLVVGTSFVIAQQHAHVRFRRALWLAEDGFPNEIRKVDLAGYKFVTNYPLGANTGFTFEQTYLAGGS